MFSEEESDPLAELVAHRRGVGQVEKEAMEHRGGEEAQVGQQEKVRRHHQGMRNQSGQTRLSVFHYSKNLVFVFRQIMRFLWENIFLCLSAKCFFIEPVLLFTSK